MFFDSRELKRQVQEYTAQARDAVGPEEKERLLRMARSYLLLAKNAAWIASTDDFLDAIKQGHRWPFPKDLSVLSAPTIQELRSK